MQKEVMKMMIWHTIRREQIHIGKGINTLPALPEESTQITVMSLITHVRHPPCPFLASSASQPVSSHPFSFTISAAASP